MCAYVCAYVHVCARARVCVCVSVCESGCFGVYMCMCVLSAWEGKESESCNLSEFAMAHTYYLVKQGRSEAD